MGCNVDTAGSTCRLGYHLCNLRDLYSGGYHVARLTLTLTLTLTPTPTLSLTRYHVARSMGWATSNSHIWTSEEFNAGGGANTSWAGGAPGATKAGLGLCCADNE